MTGRARARARSRGIPGTDQQRPGNMVYIVIFIM